MALTFGANTTDVVNCGTLGSFNGSAFTVLQWVFPTTLTSNRAYFGKGTGTNGFRCLIQSTTSNLNIIWSGTAQLQYAATAGITTGKWWFIATVVDTAAAAGSKVKVYIGDLATLAAAVSMSATSEGSGYVSIAAESLTWANRGGGGAFAFQGAMAWGGMWSSALALSAIQQQQFCPQVSSPLLFMHLGLGSVGTGTQQDWSGNGNNGTVTGATQTDHVPLEWSPIGRGYGPQVNGGLVRAFA